MALPPDPIDTVIVDADQACVAHVGALEQEGSVQRAQLDVREVLFGKVPPSPWVVSAPAAPYVLRSGKLGVFLLKYTAEGLRIVGRYGPDSYSRDEVLAAMAKRRRSP